MQKQTTPKTYALTIRRSEWYRATKNQKKGDPNYVDSITSKLLVHTKTGIKRCCMGFDTHYVCKVSDKRIEDHLVPSDLNLNHLSCINFPNPTGFNFDLEFLLSGVNDRSFEPDSDWYWANSVSNREQEKIITRLYSLAGYKVTFVD